MFLAVLIALAISGMLILCRIILGKTTYDRILATNSLGTIIVLAISVHGYFAGRPEFIDIAAQHGPPARAQEEPRPARGQMWCGNGGGGRPWPPLRMVAGGC